MKVGDRVQTAHDGPGELLSWQRDRGAFAHGWRRHRITYAVVELDRGGRVLLQARDVALERDEHPET